MATHGVVISTIRSTKMAHAISICGKSPIVIPTPNSQIGLYGEANGVKTDNLSPLGGIAPLILIHRDGSCGSLDTTTPPGGSLSAPGKAS